HTRIEADERTAHQLVAAEARARRQSQRDHQIQQSHDRDPCHPAPHAHRLIPPLAGPASAAPSPPCRAPASAPPPPPPSPPPRSPAVCQPQHTPPVARHARPGRPAPPDHERARARTRPTSTAELFIDSRVRPPARWGPNAPAAAMSPQNRRMPTRPDLDLPSLARWVIRGVVGLAALLL